MKSGQMICVLCHSMFHCGNLLATNLCWCNAYPSDVKFDINTECLCQACLKEKTVKIIDQRIKDFKSSGKLSDITNEQINSNIEGIDYYLENGLIVFKEWYLLKRGNCCNSGCRHCPYKEGSRFLRK
jgi:hypothetical protein